MDAVSSPRTDADTRPARRWWLAEVVHQKYADKGLVPLVTSTPRFVYEKVVGRRLMRAVVSRAFANHTLSRDDLRREAAAAGTLLTVGEDERFEIDHPRPGTLPPRLAASVGTYTSDAAFVCEVADATLVGPKPLAFDAEGRVVLELAEANDSYLFYRTNVALRAAYDPPARGYAHLLGDALRGRSPMATVAGDRPRAAAEHSAAAGDHAHYEVAVPLVHHFRNYYHWTAEVLPKVRLVEAYREATGVQPTIILEPNAPGWMYDTLRLAGVDPADCVEWDGTPTIVDRLVVPVHRTQYFGQSRRPFPDDFRPSPEDLRWLRARVRSNLPETEDAPFSPRVFVSRRDTTWRTTANEDEVMAALSPLGFVAYAPGELSVEDQVRLFSGAEVIVSVHSAGLVNALYAEDATVVEVLPGSKNEPYYFCLARLLGHDYEVVRCPTVDHDAVVDVDALERVVSDVCEATDARGADEVCAR